MKAISLKPPWPWLVLDGLKDIENRRWRTKFRGPILIHCSRNYDYEGDAFIRQMGYGDNLKAVDPQLFGSLLGIVSIVDCITESDSKWFFGPYGFVLSDARWLKKPIPWRGQLGIFDVPDEVIEDSM